MFMNKIKYYFLFGAISLAALSCDNFLDREPIDQITSDQYFTDESSVTSALTGVYRTLTGATY
jgi:starch-binding outer membrane protein, SusD/RagB family